MKLLIIKYPKNRITDILISLFCIFTIILILQYDTYDKAVFAQNELSTVIGFLEGNGIYVIKCDGEVKSVKFSFDNPEVLEEYDEIQKKQGYDIEPYLGCIVTRYSFPVAEIEDEMVSDNMYTTVFVYNNRIIAADIYSASVNGFIKGVKDNGENQT